MYFSKYLFYDLVDFAVKRGGNKLELYSLLDLGPIEELAPENYTSYEETARAIDLISNSLQEKYLGLYLGEELLLKAKEQVDRIMENSPTLEEAFENATTYSKMISDALYSKMDKTNEKVTVSFEVNPNWALFSQNSVQQVIDLTMVCTSKSITRLTGKKYYPTLVSFNYPRPKKLNPYYQIFNCSLLFNQPISAVTFDKTVFNKNLIGQNVNLLNSLKLLAEKVIQTLPTEPNIVNQVKKVILQSKPERLSVKQAASELNMSARTLQRKLNHLNTSYIEIDKSILIKLSTKFLDMEYKNLDEISYLLGFSESSAFVRFFKKEMKVTPNKYKKNSNKH